ncbi:MAG: SDR family oxidoreductase [Rhizobiaceae bacterium]|nr:SDR family oxidoreductase [Rhizobiaceae bacterium]
MYGETDEALATMPLSYRDGYFAGQTAIITGGGRGIGRALAFQFVRLGAKVALNGRNPERLEATAAALRAIGGDVFARVASIREPEQIQDFVAAAADRFGGIDMLVNNAGGQYAQAAFDFSVKGWRAVIENNLNGTWFVTQAVGRHMRDTGRRGSIVSIVAQTSRGMPGVAHSAAARAAVVNLTRTLATEWAPNGIRLNCVAPGVTATEGMEVYSDEARTELPKSNLMKRFGTVREVADAVCFLAGSAGSFTTGEVIAVDGGNHIWGDQWTIPRPDYFAT